MTTTVTATFDGKVLIPSGEVDLPKGPVLRLIVELNDTPDVTDLELLASLPACGIWADRTDLDNTPEAAEKLRRTLERREDHSR